MTAPIIDACLRPLLILIGGWCFKKPCVYTFLGGQGSHHFHSGPSRSPWQVNALSLKFAAASINGYPFGGAEMTYHEITKINHKIRASRLSPNTPIEALPPACRTVLRSFFRMRSSVPRADHARSHSRLMDNSLKPKNGMEHDLVFCGPMIVPCWIVRGR